jgi:hypothetical protein
MDDEQMGWRTLLMARLDAENGGRDRALAGVARVLAGALERRVARACCPRIGTGVPTGNAREALDTAGAMLPTDDTLRRLSRRLAAMMTERRLPAAPPPPVRGPTRRREVGRRSSRSSM